MAERQPLLWLWGNVAVENEKVEVYDSHSLEMLKSPDRRANATKCTKNVHDIFDREVLLMPYCTNLHWHLYAVMHPGQPDFAFWSCNSLARLRNTKEFWLIRRYLEQQRRVADPRSFSQTSPDSLLGI